MLRNRLTLSTLAITVGLSVNAQAEVVAYIHNTDGGIMYVTDARCEPAESRSLSVYTTGPDGVVTSSGCIQRMDSDRQVITWEDGAATVIQDSWMTYNKQAMAFNKTAEPGIAIETKEWMARNPWFNSPEFADATAKARVIDKQVAADGYRLGDGKYFDELDRRLLEAGVVVQEAKPAVDWTRVQ